MQKSEDVCIRYLMREMDPSEEIEFEREMMNDNNLLIEVESLRKTYQKLGKLPLLDPPIDIVSKVSSEALKHQQALVRRSSRWKAIMPKSVAASVAFILVSATGIYFLNNQASEIEGTSSVNVISSEVAPWVDRSNMIHFAGTSSQASNPEPLQVEVTNSFSKLKLISSDTGFDPPTRKIVLTSSSR